jgi:outer membrane receptor protein involved in Fe transport
VGPQEGDRPQRRPYRFDHQRHAHGRHAGGANSGTPNWNFYRTFSDDALLGRITARYEFSRTLMTYASFAKGYKGRRWTPTCS